MITLIAIFSLVIFIILAGYIIYELKDNRLPDSEIIATELVVLTLVIALTFI